MGTFSDVFTQGFGVGVGFGLVLFYLGLLALLIISYIALGYLTKFAFSAQQSPDGQQCIKLSDTQITLIKIGVVVMWVSIIIDIVGSLGQLFNK